MQNFFEDAEICKHGLNIMIACIRELPEEVIALRFVDSNVAPLLNRILSSEAKTNSEKVLALNVLFNMTLFPKTHACFISEGTLALLAQQLSVFSSKPHSDITNEDLSELILCFQVLTNFCANANDKAEIIKLQIVAKMNELFHKYNEVYFLSELFILSLKRIAENCDGVALLSTCRLDFKEMSAFALDSCNALLIEATKFIIMKVAPEKLVVSVVENIQNKVDLVSNLTILSFLADGSTPLEVLKQSSIVDAALAFVDSAKPTLGQKAAAINAILLVVSLHPSQAVYLEEVNGLEILFKKIASEQNLFVWSQMTALLVASIRQLPTDKLVLQMNKRHSTVILDKFENLSSTFDLMLRNAVTNEKAVNSISYHQGEVARFILKTLKNLKEADVIDAQLALNFLVSKTFGRNVLELIATLRVKLPQFPFELNENLMNCLLLMMKVFRSSESLHERIFSTLSGCNYSAQMTTLVCNNQWPSFLCDIVLKKPEWKRVSLFILKFVEAIMRNSPNLKILQSNVNTIKLLATIKNFIIEEDSKDFEEVEVGEDEVIPSVFKSALQSLSYAEEREINKKGTQLIEQLIDASALQTFKGNIERGVANFKPKSEIIQILRADYAVLTCVNAINFFGIEGLKSNLHLTLQTYIESLERSVNNAYFPDKEKLIADAIRSISNFICITWNDKGTKQYENSECSVLVFALLEKYLKESFSALQSYVYLKVFKEWLVNRLEIIEAYNAEQKNLVNSSDHFMLVPESKVETTIVNVLDALYQTYQRFYKNEKVVTLNLEVINLLCCVSKQWKIKVASAFIPQVLDVLNSNLYHTDCDIKAIELLKLFTGTDDRSEESNNHAINSALVSNGLTKIFRTISQSGFDPDYIAVCRPLIEGMIIQDTESDAAETKKLIDEFIKQIDDFTKLAVPQKLELNNLNSLFLALTQMNNFSLVEALKVYLKEHNFLNKVGEIWQFVNSNLSVQDDHKVSNLLGELDRACAIGVVNYVSKLPENVGEVFEDPKTAELGENSANVLLNCFKSMYRNHKDHDMVWFCAETINSCFPSNQSGLCLKIHAQLKGQPILEELQKISENGHNNEFLREVHDLYLNLNDVKNDDHILRLLKKNYRALDEALASKSIPDLINGLKDVSIYLSHPLVAEHPNDFGLENRLISALTLLKESVSSKVNKISAEIVEQALSSMGVPDLTTNDKNKLKEEIQLSQNLLAFLEQLPPSLQETLQKNDRVIQLLDLPLVLNGEISSLKVLDRLLQVGDSPVRFNQAKMLEAVTYILLRKNKDSFKPNTQIAAEDCEKSVIFSLKHSTVAGLGASVILTRPKEPSGNNMFVSTLPGEEPGRKSRIFEQSRVEQIAENLAIFTKVVGKLVDQKKLDEVVAAYLRALRDYQNDSVPSVFEAIVVSRQMICLLHIKEGDFDFSSHSEPLLAEFPSFYRKMALSPSPNKKFLRLTESILGKFAKRFNKSKHALRSNPLWNKMLNFYLVVQPELVAGNAKRIWGNLGLTKPILAKKDYIRQLFDTSTGKFHFEFDFSAINVLSAGNQKSLPVIYRNLQSAVAKTRITTEQLFSLLEGLTRSQTAAAELLSQELFGTFVLLLNGFQDFDNKRVFDDMATVLINCMGVAADDRQLRTAVNKKVHSDNYCKKFFDAIDGFHKPLFKKSLQALVHVYRVVDNPSGFFDEKIPEKLLEILGPAEDWSPAQENFFVLLALMVENDSFENVLLGLGYQTMIHGYLASHIIEKEVKLFKLAPAKGNQVLLSPDADIRLIEILVYSMGEFSKYIHQAPAILSQDKTVATFQYYKAFQLLASDCVLGVKLIETVRNFVFAMSEAEVSQSADQLEEVKKSINAELQIHLNVGLITKYLHDILGFMNNRILESKKKASGSELVVDEFLRRFSRGERTAIQDLESTLIQREGVSFTISDIVDLLKQMCKVLAERKLSDSETTLFSVCMEKLGFHFSKDNTSQLFTLYSLEIPVYLRLIANLENSESFFRKESLVFLLAFASVNDLLLKMLSSDFYVEKSEANIISIFKISSDVDQLSAENSNILEKDLNFLQMLSREPVGAERVIELELKGTLLMPHLMVLIKSPTRNVLLKAVSLVLLNNILNVKLFVDIEQDFIKNREQLFADNQHEVKVVIPLLNTFAIIARGSKENKIALVNGGLLDNLKAVIDVFQRDDIVNRNIAVVLLELCTDCPENHQKVLGSAILPYMASAFNNAVGEKRLYDVISKMILQIGFQSAEKKLKLVNIGFAAGLITLFDLFSMGELYDQEICVSILKCMANFSAMPIGAEHLLKDQAIHSFKKYFDVYKETMPEQIKLLMVTISNMAYMPKQANLDMIVQDGGVQLILDCLAFAESKNNEALLEVCLDALTQVSSDSKALQFLQLTNAIDAILDVVRRQTNDQLIYKGLMSMNQLSRYEYFSQRIFDKGGHAVAAEVIRTYPKDLKNLLQSLKLIKSLLVVYPDRPQKFIQAGIPEKIVKAFSEDWPYA